MNSNVMENGDPLKRGFPWEYEDPGPYFSGNMGTPGPGVWGPFVK